MKYLTVVYEIEDDKTFTEESIKIFEMFNNKLKGEPSKGYTVSAISTSDEISRLEALDIEAFSKSNVYKKVKNIIKILEIEHFEATNKNKTKEEDDE